jgi:hypothetical protein
MIRYYVDFIGFIKEQLSLVVKVSFLVEGKMKVSFCVLCSVNGYAHVLQNWFIFFSNFCYLAVSMLQLMLSLDIYKCGL